MHEATQTPSTLDNLQEYLPQDRRYLWLAAAAVGAGAAFLIASRSRSHEHSHAAEGHLAAEEHVSRTITVGRPVAEVFEFWRNLENLPQFMQHVISIEMRGPNRSYWVVRGPMGKRIEWEAQTTYEVKNELIAWRTLPGASVEHSGQVEFREAPGGRGTEVRVHFSYTPPAGKVGRAVAMVLGEEPDMQVREDLRHLKQLLETGIVPTANGQPSGKRGPRGYMMQRALGETSRTRGFFRRGERLA